jgi:hypothetical protein
VIIVGEEGVGRKTIVRNFALQLYNGKTNAVLMYKRVLKLDLEKLLAKTADFVSRQELLKSILKEAADAKNIILYIENFEKYVSTQDSMIDLSTVFEEYARSPRVQFIALTTPAAYQKYIFKNAKIATSFEKLDITEISEQDTFQIILEANLHGVEHTLLERALEEERAISRPAELPPFPSLLLADGAMIGRGIFADPYAFAKKSPWPEMTKNEKLSLFKKHIELFAKTWTHGERRFETIKKFVKIYTSGIDDASELRDKIMHCTSPVELLALVTATIDADTTANSVS